MGPISFDVQSLFVEAKNRVFKFDYQEMNTFEFNVEKLMFSFAQSHPSW